MANIQGIAITIKAFLPTGKTLDEQFAALGIVKAAHETGDYTALLKAANIDEVKTENKVRRIEDKPVPTIEAEVVQETSATSWPDEATPQQEPSEAGLLSDEPIPEAVPDFLKNKKSKAA